MVVYLFCIEHVQNIFNLLVYVLDILSTEVYVDLMEVNSSKEEINQGGSPYGFSHLSPASMRGDMQVRQIEFD